MQLSSISSGTWKGTVNAPGLMVRWLRDWLRAYDPELEAKRLRAEQLLAEKLGEQAAGKQDGSRRSG